MVNKDALWKGIIEDLVEEFGHYFFSEFIEQIDLERSFAPLDKELKQLSPQSEAKLRHADKLFKAWLKNGEEQWFLVHVEVQGYTDPDFARRMYQYAYRIQDRFNRPIAALAIYTGINRKYHYKKYQVSFFGTELIYRFGTYVLIDQDPSVLRKSNNLFSLVMEVARQELNYKKGNDEQRLSIKKELIQHLFQQGVSKKKIRSLLDFIKYYTRFDQEYFFNKFEEEIHLITKSRQAMGIREAILHDVKKTGFEEGKAKGIEKGMEKGKEEKERTFVKRALQKGLALDEIAELADISKKKVERIIEEFDETEKENKGFEGSIPPVSKSMPSPNPAENKKKRLAIIHAWQIGLHLDDIAGLADIPVEEVEAIIQAYSDN